MKKWGILLLAALAGLVVLAGCQPAVDLSAYLSKTDASSTYATAAQLAAAQTALANQTATCMQCHLSSDTTLTSSSTTTYVGPIVAAEGGYENSGHLNGPRVFTYNATVNAGTREFDGSDANYANGSSCDKCHTSQGFVDWATNGAPATKPGTTTANTDPNATNVNANTSYSPPSCFTCHNPHTNFNMNVRAIATVNLPSGFPTSGLTYTSTSNFQMTNVDVPATGTNETTTATTATMAGGAGSLCANCHQARTAWAAPSASYVAIASYWGPHHGPMTDVYMGVNNASVTGGVITAPVPSVHQMVGDTCVGCHMYQPTGQSGTSMEVAGHGMYLTADVHGVPADFTALCATCHVSGGAATNMPASTVRGTPFTTLIASSGNILADIRIAEATLLGYFADSSKFYTDATNGILAAGATPKYAVVVSSNYDHSLSGTALTAALIAASIATPTSTNSYNENVQHKTWEFNPATPYVSAAQAKALWNFKLFEEDKSYGIHNPKYAAELLYDAIVQLNIAPTSAGLSQPTDWSTTAP